jgi:hypothetical protein
MYLRDLEESDIGLLEIPFWDFLNRRTGVNKKTLIEES